MTEIGLALETDWPDRITERYLLVLNVALYRSGGGFWAEPLWAKDLALHLCYLERLTLFCPVIEKAPPPDWQEVDPAIEVVSAGAPSWGMLLRLPGLTLKMLSIVKRADVVHIGVAGWPFPLGWLAVPLARLARRFLIVIVESSFWRAAPEASWRKRVRAAITERINRACVNACDLALFTTAAYRDSLATRPRGRTFVTPATWIDSDHVVDLHALERIREAKEQRLLYAGRLTDEKGVGDLLEAVALTDIAVDIVGSGELAAACAALATRFPARLRMLDPVPYGAAFSALIDCYPAIIVPTRSEEQPRILFDAFARAVPAIVSNTSANLEMAEASRACQVVPVGDPLALAGTIGSALGNPEAMRGLGLKARDFAASRTHAGMHRQRARIIREALDSSRA